MQRGGATPDRPLSLAHAASGALASEAVNLHNKIQSKMQCTGNNIPLPVLSLSWPGRSHGASVGRPISRHRPPLSSYCTSSASWILTIFGQLAETQCTTMGVGSSPASSSTSGAAQNLLTKSECVRFPNIYEFLSGNGAPCDGKGTPRAPLRMRQPNRGYLFSA